MFCFVVIWFWTTNNILHESYNLQTEEQLLQIIENAGRIYKHTIGVPCVHCEQDA